MNLDYTKQGRRPTAAQIVSAWKRAGRPSNITVEYGETFAEFELRNAGSPFAFWNDSGNGCRGVDRGAVVKALTIAVRPAERGFENRYED